MRNEMKNYRPVRLYRYPVWLTGRIRSAISDGRIYLPGWPNRTWSKCHLVHRIFCQTNVIWDHWGVPVGQPEILVSEPYRSIDDPELVEAVKKFSDQLQLRFSISKKSNWNPGQTIRIEFWRDFEISKLNRGFPNRKNIFEKLKETR
jgi:hypothetical protein